MLASWVLVKWPASTVSVPLGFELHVFSSVHYIVSSFENQSHVLLSVFPLALS